MTSASGNSAFQLIFGSTPVDPYEWGEKDEDMLFAQDAWAAVQFAQQ